MNIRHLLLYPPLSWLLAWAINDAAVDQAHTQWLHNHKDPSR